MKKENKKIKHCEIPPSLDKMKRVEPFGAKKWNDKNPFQKPDFSPEQPSSPPEISETETIINVANIEMTSIHVNKVWVSKDKGSGSIGIWSKKPFKKAGKKNGGWFYESACNTCLLRLSAVDAIYLFQIFGTMPEFGKCIGPFYLIVGS